MANHRKQKERQKLRMKQHQQAMKRQKKLEQRRKILFRNFGYNTPYTFLEMPWWWPLVRREIHRERQILHRKFSL